jgi:hypothetical protein
MLILPTTIFERLQELKTTFANASHLHKSHSQGDYSAGLSFGFMLAEKQVTRLMNVLRKE